MYDVEWVVIEVADTGCGIPGEKLNMIFEPFFSTKMVGAEMRCAAYPNYGRICWAVAGAFCEKRVSGAITQKLGDCRKCGFYQRVVMRKDL